MHLLLHGLGASMNRPRSQSSSAAPHLFFCTSTTAYHIAGEIEDRSRLLIMTPEKMWARSRVQVYVNHEVLSIDRSARTVKVRRSDGAEQDFPYDKLILSQGAKPIVPPIPGAELPNVFTLRDVPDMDQNHISFSADSAKRRTLGLS